MLHCDHQADRTTVHVAGRFDFRCVNEFNAMLTRKSVAWTVDLAKVDYVDSSALGMLLLLREHAGSTGAQVSLRGAHGQVRDVLVMAKFDRMFRLED